MSMEIQCLAKIKAKLVLLLFLTKRLKCFLFSYFFVVLNLTASKVIKLGTSICFVNFDES